MNGKEVGVFSAPYKSMRQNQLSLAFLRSFFQERKRSYEIYEKAANYRNPDYKSNIKGP